MWNRFCLSVSLCCILGAGFPMAAPAGDAKLIAHRGGVVDDQRIENSLPAVDEAVNRGYWMLEVDVRESKDGHLVVHHDPNFWKFYKDKRKVADMTWDEIKELRSTPGDQRPLEFHEYAAACKGRIRLMLDTKSPDHPPEFFDSMEKSLRENDLLESAYFIGTSQSQQRFADLARISVNRKELQAAIDAGEDVASKYFLFEHGNALDKETVELAQQHGVPVVPSVNIFHYLGGNHLSKAAADIHRLRKLGVEEFQIDSVYEEFCRD